MKKIFTIISIAVLAAAAVSCNKLNEYPVFDDADAFVSFGAPSVSCEETDGVVKIPVTASSVAGLKTTIAFEVEDGTAKAGTNYKVSGAKTLSFDADHRTNYISIDVVNLEGVFTGDLKFSVKITSGGDLAVGADDVCTVTIADLDHPLAFILGDYTASGSDYNGAPLEWTMTLKKDAEDVNVVWFYNLFCADGWADDDTMYYGVVNEDKTQITIPIGQGTEYKYSNGNPVSLYSFDEDEEDVLTGNIVVDIKDDGKTLQFDNQPMWFYIEGAGTLNTVMGGTVCTK